MLFLLLCAFYPPLLPFLPLLQITGQALMLIHGARDVIELVQLIREYAPEAMPALERLAAHFHQDVDQIATIAFAPHFMTVAERDYWQDHLNKARNI